MSKKKYTIGDSGTIDILLIGGAALAAYVFVLKPLLNAAGVDPASQGTINNQMAMAPAADPFSYQFQPFLDFYNNNTPQISASQVSAGFFNNMMNLLNQSIPVQTINPTIQQFFQSLKQSPPASSPWGFINTVDLSARAEALNNAISVSALNPFATSDQTGALSALSGLTNQLQIAFIANYFWWNFNSDLLTFLNGSLLKSGMTPQNLAAVINSVNSLPVNPS